METANNPERSKPSQSRDDHCQGPTRGTMKAAVCNVLGSIDNLHYEDFPIPQLDRRQVRVGIHAAGMNWSDALKVQGLHQTKVPPPYIPGSEFAGEVLEVGTDVDCVAVGERVIGVGTTQGGGYAEQIAIDARRVLKMPAEMSFIEGAALPSVYGTAVYALRQCARLTEAETLLVIGAAGGAGLSAVQVGAAMGARVIAAASTAEKCALAKAHGAHETIVYSEGRLRDTVRALTEGQGADVIFDPVGGAATEEATHCIAFGGRLLIVGFASGEIPSLRLNLALVKGFNVCGIRYDVWRDRNWDLAAENFGMLFGWVRRSVLRPYVGTTYPLSQATDALKHMVNRGTRGKTVLVTDRHAQLS